MSRCSETWLNTHHVFCRFLGETHWYLRNAHDTLAHFLDWKLTSTRPYQCHHKLHQGWNWNRLIYDLDGQDGCTLAYKTSFIYIYKNHFLRLLHFSMLFAIAPRPRCPGCRLWDSAAPNLTINRKRWRLPASAKRRSRLGGDGEMGETFGRKVFCFF